jgi:hypothetical protein
MITLHPSLTMQDVAASFKEFELSLGSRVQILNSPENTEAMLAWLEKNAQHPDGKGVYPTAAAIKRGAAELHRAGELVFVAGHEPRTQEQIRAEEEAKKYPEVLTQPEVRRQTQEQAKSATIMALLRRRTEIAAADVRSYYHKQRIREALKKFFEDFIKAHPVEKLTAAEAESFEKSFYQFEIKVYGEK